MVKPRQPAWMGIALCVALALLPACQNRNKFIPPPPPQVTLSKPTRDQVTGYLEFTGNTQAVVTVQLTARVPGYLEQVLFHDGDMVRKDQPLFVIEQAPYQAKLQQAEGQLMQVKAQLAHAETEFSRFSDLKRQNAAAQTDVENWRFQRDNARAALTQASAARDLARLDLAYSQVTAPFDGRIDRRLVDPGNLVGIGGNTALATINQIDPIYVYFNINETDLLKRIRATGLTPGEAEQRKIPVDLGLAGEDGYPHRGVLDFTGISLNSTTGSLLLRAIFANADGKILPGLFARVRTHQLHSQREALLVPETALSFDQQGTYILTVNAKNVVERRGISLGAAHGDRRIVESGLQGDESIVVSGLLRAIPGTTVTPVRQGAEKTDGPAVTQTPSNVQQ
jgi:RND family efflux transporter MFP subunit